MSAAQSLASVSISPSSVVGGDSTTGTIKLTANAPANGFDVQVSCAHSYVQVPATVTVPAGSNIKTFSISTSLVTSKSSATVTFSAGSQSLHATLTVSPSLVPLQRISVTPASVIGTYSSKGKITLTEQAQGAGETVFLASDQSCAQVPASIVVPGGGTSATITVTTHRVSAPTTATLTASVKGVAGTVSCALDVEAWPVQSVSLTPNPVVGGFAVSGVVTLGLRAPQGGIDVQLSSQMGYATPTVGTITIKAGYLTGSFKVRTAVTPNQRFDTVSATTGGPPATAPITIDPPTVTSLTLSPTTVSGGSTSTGTVTVSLPAPAGGEVIHLANDSTIATVPSTVVVAAGYKTAKFTVQTGVLGANCFADITASVPDSSAKAPLNVMGNGLGASAWPQIYQNSQNTTLGVASGANGVHKWGMFRDDGVFTVPVLGADGTLYIGFDNVFYALNPDGSEKWNFTVPRGSRNYGKVEYAIVGPDNTIYLESEADSSLGPDADYVFAFMPDGTQKWSKKTSKAIYPACILPGGELLGVSYSDGTLYKLSSSSGATLWSVHLGSEFWNLPTVAIDGTIYVGTGDPLKDASEGTVFSISPAGIEQWSVGFNSAVIVTTLSSTGEILAGTNHDGIYSLKPDSSQHWHVTDSNVGHQTGIAVGSDGSIYYNTTGSPMGSLTALNSDGSSKWSVALDEFSEFQRPSVATDGTVYAGIDSTQSSSSIAAFGPDGSLKWSLDTGSNYQAFAGPAIGADGSLYVSLYGFDVFLLGQLLVIGSGTPPPMSRANVHKE